MNYTVNSTEISNDIKAAYFCVLLSELCVGVTGNIILLIVFRKMGPRSNIDWYIIFITIIEIIVLLTTVPLYIIQNTELWLTFGSDLVCKLSYFEVQGFTTEMSILMCLISMERVYAICKPSKIYIPRERVKYVILASLFAAFIASAPTLLINWSVSDISCTIIPPLIFGFIFYVIVTIFCFVITLFVLVSHIRIICRIYKAGNKVAANESKSQMTNSTTVDKKMSCFHQQNEITTTVSFGKRNGIRDQVEGALLVRLSHICVDVENPHVNVSGKDVYLKEGPDLIENNANIKDDKDTKHSEEKGFCPYISGSKTHAVQNQNSDVCTIQHPIENFALNDDSGILVDKIKPTSENVKIGLGNISIIMNNVTEGYLLKKVQEPPLGPLGKNQIYPGLLETAFARDIHNQSLNTDIDNHPENNRQKSSTDAESDGQKSSTDPENSNKDFVILDRKQNPGNPTASRSKSSNQKVNPYSSLNARARKCATQTTKIVLLLAIFHFSSWVLDCSVLIICFVFPGKFLVLTMFLKQLYLINCCVNSFLYIGFDTRFRKTLYRLVCGRD
ncbi:hypothetical protein ACJMK2_035017 [Sinanodonta woodiana]|uniref:G-protein coupled receptors family 1 profile domain-containing protein n=1 Tax=Sinanodonta woodiana TaxID=1069815 RepID=A0ABD3WXJ2_SINWO